MLIPARPGWAGRFQRTREAAAAIGLDAVVVSTPANIAYLTGFTGSAGLLVVSTSGDAWLLVDGRYQTSVREGLADGSLGPVRQVLVPSRYDAALVDLLRTAGITRAGFEAAHVTVATLRDWQGLSPRVTWSPTEGLIERLRAIKDAFELSVIRRAAVALSGVARQLPALVAPGLTEREVARAIDRALERAGFQKPAFDTIVAGGPHSAHPHARPTDRRLGIGNLVLLDFGGVLDGYCVDLTRVAGIGQMPVTILSLYEAVRAAQDAAIAAVRHGVLGSDVNRAARAVLESRGLGEAFSHGTGHGLGRDVHEAPRLGRADSGPSASLEAGMVCTIEPGAYLEGLGGVRLEDDVLVTATGCEVLTDAPREMMVV